MEQGLEALVRAQVEAVQGFFAAWYTGAVAADEARLRQAFVARLHPQFLFVSSYGAVMDGARMVDEVRAAHGASPDLRLAIHDLRLRHAGADGVLVTYQEWQQSGGDSAGVITSLLLERPPALRWLHAHETALPGPPPPGLFPP